METKVQVKLHPRLLALINPRVLDEVTARIEAREQDDALDDRNYRRYLNAHADHIQREIVRRDSKPDGSAPSCAA
jgi:hypothetical protein